MLGRVVLLIVIFYNSLPCATRDQLYVPKTGSTIQYARTERKRKYDVYAVLQGREKK